MRSKRPAPLNLLELKPIRNVEWERNGDESVVLLVPKFKNRLLVKWLIPQISKLRFQVKLDQYGSFIWNRCDGTTTVGEIAELMAEKFGQPVDSLHSRIGLFLQRLIRDKFLMLNVDHSST